MPPKNKDILCCNHDMVAKLKPVIRCDAVVSSPSSDSITCPSISLNQVWQQLWGQAGWKPVVGRISECVCGSLWDGSHSASFRILYAGLPVATVLCVWDLVPFLHQPYEAGMTAPFRKEAEVWGLGSDVPSGPLGFEGLSQNLSFLSQSLVTPLMPFMREEAGEMGEEGGQGGRGVAGLTGHPSLPFQAAGCPPLPAPS